MQCCSCYSVSVLQLLQCFSVAVVAVLQLLQPSRATIRRDLGCVTYLEENRLMVVSLAKETGLDVPVELLLVAVADGQERLGVEYDAVLVHLLDLVEVDDVGTVYAHEV